MDIRRGWRTRGHLPHADFAGLTQAITFRLADALPAAVIDRLRTHVRAAQPGAAPDVADALLRAGLHEHLDAGHGCCLLRQPESMSAVTAELRRHDGDHYDLLAYAIMPNHVHVLARMRSVSLGQVVQRWKGASAQAINRFRRADGTIWQHEYFDRFVRDDQGLAAAVRYVADNPVKAGLGDGYAGLWIRQDMRTLIAPAAD